MGGRRATGAGSQLGYLHGERRTTLSRRRCASGCGGQKCCALRPPYLVLCDAGQALCSSFSRACVRNMPKAGEVDRPLPARPGAQQAGTCCAGRLMLASRTATPVGRRTLCGSTHGRSIMHGREHSRHRVMERQGLTAKMLSPWLAGSGSSPAPRGWPLRLPCNCRLRVQHLLFPKAFAKERQGCRARSAHWGPCFRSRSRRAPSSLHPRIVSRRRLSLSKPFAAADAFDGPMCGDPAWLALLARTFPITCAACDAAAEKQHQRRRRRRAPSQASASAPLGVERGEAAAMPFPWRRCTLRCARVPWAASLHHHALVHPQALHQCAPLPRPGTHARREGNSACAARRCRRSLALPACRLPRRAALAMCRALGRRAPSVI
jgi:hypothetical protein